MITRKSEFNDYNCHMLAEEVLNPNGKYQGHGDLFDLHEGLVLRFDKYFRDANKRLSATQETIEWLVKTIETVYKERGGTQPLSKLDPSWEN